MNAPADAFACDFCGVVFDVGGGPAAPYGSLETHVRVPGVRFAHTSVFACSAACLASLASQFAVRTSHACGVSSDYMPEPASPIVREMMRGGPLRAPMLAGVAFVNPPPAPPPLAPSDALCARFEDVLSRGRDLARAVEGDVSASLMFARELEAFVNACTALTRIVTAPPPAPPTVRVSVNADGDREAFDPATCIKACAELEPLGGIGVDLVFGDRRWTVGGEEHARGAVRALTALGYGVTSPPPAPTEPAPELSEDELAEALATSSAASVIAIHEAENKPIDRDDVIERMQSDLPFLERALRGQAAVLLERFTVRERVRKDGAT